MGSRINLREMGNAPNPVSAGSIGTLQCLDDIGAFHATFDNGRRLGLVMGEDSFTVLPLPTQVLKLCMPMTVGHFHGSGECEKEIT